MKVGMDCAEERVAHTQLELERMRESRQREIEKATRDVVKQYHLLRDCFHRKDSYASYFSKFSFYLCHNFLKSRRLGDSFSEATFDNTMSPRTLPD